MTGLRDSHAQNKRADRPGETMEGGPKMPSILNEAWEWLDRAEQAREVAGQLNDPGARKAVLELAESFERLARAAAAPTAARRRELATQDQERS
jgi:hypothetical protein